MATTGWMLLVSMMAGYNIGHNLPNDFEASGVAVHRGLFYVVDDSEGRVAALTEFGQRLAMWRIRGDLEGIAADRDTGWLYIAREDRSEILVFDPRAGRVLFEYDLSRWIDDSNNQGMEALAFHDGTFYVGNQGDGSIWVFRSGILGPYVEDIIDLPYDDLSGLHYSETRGTLLALFNGSKTVLEITTSGYILNDWRVYGDRQDGITVTDCNTLVIADERSGVYLYENSFDSCFD